MPRIVPSVAAETVPEYIILVATLAPKFIPEMTKSGGCFKIALTAILTQSAGVPLTE